MIDTKTKVILALFILAMGVLAAAILVPQDEPVVETGPDCVEVAELFVDLDGDGDQDMLTEGCAVFNDGGGQVPTGNQPEEAPQAQAPAPTPQVFPQSALGE